MRRLVLTMLAVAVTSNWAMAAGPAGEKKPVGFESGVAARNLSAEDKDRIAAFPLEDLLDRNKGRYTFLKADDGVLSYWGLDAVRARKTLTNKPYDSLRDAAGIYQTERVIFADLSTGATMMQLTNENAGDSGDETCYFGRAAFSADGAVMVWQRSLKYSFWSPPPQLTTDTHGPLIMNADGTAPRIAFKEMGAVSLPICSPTDPGAAYAMAGPTPDHARDLVELDLRTGKVKRTIATGLRVWQMKVSPDGKYACTVQYAGGPTKPIVVVQLSDGKKWEIKLEGAIHDSLRFVPGDTDVVMFWYESVNGGLRGDGIRMANFKTGEVTTNKVHFDWNHGDVGRYFGFHLGGLVVPWDAATKAWQQPQNLFWPDNTKEDSGPYYSIPVKHDGYATLQPDDQRWGLGVCVSQEKEYLSEISEIYAQPFPDGGRVNRFRLCITNQLRDFVNNKGTLLSRPNQSPDGTKVIYDSNPFAKATIYMTVVRNPLPPVNVMAGGAAGAVKVSWEAPQYHSEIGGFLVYRSSESGRGFEPITDKPIAETSYTDATAAAGKTYFYAVRSVERSRLLSPLSPEVEVNLAGGAATWPVRAFCEAEDAVATDLKAPSPDALWVNFEGMASNMYYVWQRRSDKPGRAGVEVNVPRAGGYYVVARMKGKDGAEFTIAGQKVSVPAGKQWAWARADEAVDMKAGRQAIEIVSSRYGSCLDCFYLATDKDFAPDGRIVAETPKAMQLKAEPAAAGQVKLSWTGDKSAQGSHFNVYCSDKADFAPDRATLIASPDGTEFLDWQAGSGTRYYRVKQVTMDGVESAPSNAAEVAVGK